MYSAYIGGTALNRAKHIGPYGSVSEERLVVGCDNHNSLNYDSVIHIPSVIGQTIIRSHDQSLDEEVKLFKCLSYQKESRASSMDSNFISKFRERGRADQVEYPSNATSTSAKKNWRTIEEMQKGLKRRKTSDSDYYLDLNLSLKAAENNEDKFEKDLEVDGDGSSLSLSLSSKTYSSKHGRLKEEADGSRKHARWTASTVDLTL